MLTLGTKRIYDGVEAETRKSQAEDATHISENEPEISVLRSKHHLTLIIFLTHHLNHFDSEQATSAVQAAILFYMKQYAN